MLTEKFNFSSLNDEKYPKQKQNCKSQKMYKAGFTLQKNALRD